MNTKGVYEIRNNKTNMVYIGSTTTSFNQRWSEHKRTLKSNSHHCSYLRNS